MNKRSRIRYELVASPLFKVWTPKRLALRLGFDLSNLQEVGSRGIYRHFEIDARACQQPLGLTRAVQDRIAILLSRMTVPSYLHSVKGSSYASNAAQHIGGVPSVRLDIRKFYPSTKEPAIRNFFRHELACSPKVATLLAAICTCNGALPTGSPISSYLAYFANVDLFSSLAALAESVNCTISVYVDDITFTGEHATAALLDEAVQIVHRSNLRHNRYKSRVLPAGSPKRITGVIVTSSGVAVPNSRQKRIGELFRERATMDGVGAGLVGRLWEAAQIAPHFKLKVPTALAKHASRRK
jgi:RNA-directed DNA polymerase